MANLTRIKNNQITDSTVNAAAKLQDYSVTSGKLANSLVYGSDLTISGNLTVNGTTTAIDTVNTLIQDPIITLADGQVSGTPTVDIGFLGLRGSQNSSFMGWNEGNTEFAVFLSNTTVSNTTANINSYGNFHAANIKAANLSLSGNITSSLNVIGNITGGNVTTTGLLSATGNVTGGNVNAGSGAVSTTGNVYAGNVINTGLSSVTGNVIGGNITTGGLISATGNATAGNVLTGGVVSAVGNITANTGSFFIGNGSQLTGVTATSAGFPITAGTSNIAAASNGNIGITVGAASNIAVFTTSGVLVTGLISANGNVTGGNVNAGSGAVSTTGNVYAGNVINTGISSVTGNVIGGNITTGGLVSATGNVTGGNVNVGSGAVSTTGNVYAGNVINTGISSVTGNITGGNILTGGQVSATGNVTGAIVNTPSVVGATVTISTTGNGAISLSPAGVGNVSVNSRYINSLADPVQDQDAATKIYVDTVATGLDPKASVLAATANTLAVYSGGTVSYNNGASGVGANLVTTGTYTTIDGANVQTANTRVLVKNEANTTWNGIYVWSNATVLTRAADFNQPAEVPSAFTFVETGTTNADTGWVCTTNAPVTFGTTAITFTQFSGAGTYTAGNALSLNGTQFNVNIDTSGANTIGINGSNQLYIPTGAVLTNPNITAATGTSLSVTGTVTSSSVVGGVITGSSTSVTGTTTAASVVGGVMTGSSISVTGTATAASVVGGVITGSSTSVTGTTTAASVVGGVMTGTSVSVTGNVTGGNLLTSGSGGAISGSGNITGGNILTGGSVSASGTVTAASVVGGVITGTSLSVTGNVNAGNVINTGISSVTGNLTAGNVLTGGLVSATGNVTGGNILYGAGNVSGTGNVYAGNVINTGISSVTGNLTAGNISTAGTATLGNIVIAGQTINDNVANGTININSSLANTNFVINGQGANVFYVNAVANTASFGSSAQTTNAVVAFNATNSILMPVGTTSQKPATGVTGMLRFNSTLNSLELYNNSAWTTVGATAFTVIADEQFNGDGSNVAFTLGSTQTTNSCIVSINGVVQIPVTAYSVAGTYPTCVLTFTEAPASGDLIDVRELTTTTTVTSLSNGSGNATFAGSATAAQFDLTGNLIPTGNATANIGNATNQFNTIFAKATSAQYADLAEKYSADADYAPGTVVSFGGSAEITQSNTNGDSRVAGVVSTNPSYIMNSALDSEFVALVALTGRAPTKVTGTVAKGDLMVSNGDGTARAETDPQAGAIIGKALENFTGDTGVIEVVVGRF